MSSAPDGNVHVTLDIAAIQRLMGLGVNRASAFMSLGLRSAADGEITSVALDANSQWRFWPDPISAEQSAEIRSNFQNWVVGNGLRELDQWFAKACDMAHGSYSIMEAGMQMPLATYQDATRAFFAKTNVGDKLQTLRTRFGARAGSLESVRSLATARNALTHNGGLVSEKHTADGGDLILRWRGLDILAGDQTIQVGHDFAPFTASGEEGRGVNLSIRVSERIKRFLIGSEIVLQPNELHEICFTYWQQAEELAADLSAFAQAHEIIPPV